jgi:hypothetical protein
MALYRNVAGAQPGYGYLGLLRYDDPGGGDSGGFYDSYGGATIDPYQQNIIDYLRPDVTAPVITDPSTPQVLVLQPDATVAPPQTVEQPVEPVAVTSTGGTIPASDIYSQNILDALRNDTGGTPVLPAPLVDTTQPITVLPIPTNSDAATPLPVTTSHNPPAATSTTMASAWLPLLALAATVGIAVAGEAVIKHRRRLVFIGGVGLTYWLLNRKTA